MTLPVGYRLNQAIRRFSAREAEQIRRIYELYCANPAADLRPEMDMLSAIRGALRLARAAFTKHMASMGISSSVH